MCKGAAAEMQRQSEGGDHDSQERNCKDATKILVPCPYLQDLMHTKWDCIESPGDHSPYVDQICKQHPAWCTPVASTVVSMPLPSLLSRNALMRNATM
eukprot:scaffold52978_cov17-Tisochrysis_lutea.AAC.2